VIAQAPPWWLIAVTALVFTCATFLTIQFAAHVCKNVVPFEDGPRVGTPPVAGLLAGSFVVGGLLGWHTTSLALLGIELVLVVSLAAAWYSDVRCGIVPDYFTLVPLALVLGVAVLTRQFGPVISAAVVFVPFACAALFSKGRGMGWGDVKLATLGAAVLPLEAAILAFAGACFAAVCVAVVRKRRSEPIAFAPYLAGAIALGMAVPVFT
jgi:prepilin signal peptidase PulO-like enzyme (type II secretory pathway)